MRDRMGMGLGGSLETRAAGYAALGDPTRLAVVEALALGDRTPGELAEELGLRSNLLAFHLDVLEGAGLIGRRASAGDGRRRYLRLEWGAMDGLWRPPRVVAERLLFVCHHNAARSQLAEACWRARSEVPVASAGMAPAERVHPEAMRVAGERGLDLARSQPKGYAQVAEPPDLVVSVCDLTLEAAPPFPEARALHWSIPDPVEAGEPRAFDGAMDEIEARVDRLARAMKTTR